MNKDLSEAEWSPQLAYAIGLIATDGCLSLDKRHIDLTSKDIQLLKTFKKCLGLKNKIGLKNGGKSDKKYYRVQFGNVKFYQWLAKIGLAPHKTKTIEDLDIPDKFFFDFLRGCFDGDGSCYGYWDKRWASSYMFYTQFVSASKKHIFWLKSRIGKLSKIEGSLSQIGKTPIYQLKYAKRESRVLIAKMYHKQSLPYLKRKYKKLEKFLNIDDKEAEKSVTGE